MKFQVERLFHDLADLPPEARSQYFAEHHVDEDTRHEVEALLMFDSGAISFLLRDIRIAASRSVPQLEGKGGRCGPYRLLDVIGRGGMGAVYLAERADGEVSQRVAVKLLPPGAGDPQRERFLQERQILASLAHPNIARMLDAGHLDNGQPFLAMEYVDGKPIDEFAAGFSVRQKIALFVKICAAVGYLHRNLIVHRDLKPSNILVTDEGEPKLLDFGIAKILDLATDSTLTSVRMLTPDYASPEQVTGARVSTATDIYSLGAVLYRLLAGKPPHEFEEKSAEAIASAITAREATRPSKLAPELKGDVESILLKALRKEPQERYATVEQLADDLEAFLQWRCVRARSGNAWYRTRKFLRRYRVPVTAAGLVMASLAAGLYTANRQRMLAERRLDQLRQFSNKLFVQLNADLSDLPGTILARSNLVATETQYLEGLGASALHNKDLAFEIAQAYLRIARIQGAPAWNSLGRYADAEQSLRKADRFTESALSADPGSRKALRLSALIAHDRALVAYVARRPEQVLAQTQKVLLRFEKLMEVVRPEHLNVHEAGSASYVYGDLAEIHIALHRFHDAARYARMGVEVSQLFSEMIAERVQALNMLAGSLMYLGDFRGALQAIQDARNLKNRLSSSDIRGNRLFLSQCDRWEGLILGDDAGVSLNRPREAGAALQEAFDIAEALAKAERCDYQSRSHLAAAGLYLGNVLRHSNPRRALEVFDQSLVRIREVPDNIEARRAEALLLAGSSYAARWMHREKEARERIDRAFRLLRETKDYPARSVRPGSEADTAVRALAEHYAETRQPKQAVEAYQQLRQQIAASNPEPRNDLVNAAHLSRLDASLAALLRRVGRKNEAATPEENRLALWRHWQRKLPDNPFVLRQVTAAAWH